jgi:hypothetical protein
VKVLSQLKQREMEKFNATLSTISSGNGNWDGNTGKFKQLFKGITGYDIMLEESRKDIAPVNYIAISAQSAQVLSGMLSNSIKKCLILLHRE